MFVAFDEESSSTHRRLTVAANPGGSNQNTKYTSDGFMIPEDVDMPPLTSPAGVQNDFGLPQQESGSAQKVCVHCTFAENLPGATDCEVCGLPLD